jgi:tetratricopeptide (TPR) repeat protein
MKEIYHHKIRSLLKKGDWLNAGIEACKLSRMYPTDQDVRDSCNLIMGYLLHQYPNFQPCTSEEFMWRGIVGFNHRDVFETLRDFGKAITLDPKNHFALKWRASILASFASPHLNNMAKSDLISAISFCPLASYYEDLGAIYTSEKDHESALFYHLKSLKYGKKEDQCSFVKLGTYAFNAGLSYWHIGKYKEARSMFYKTLKFLPGHTQAVHYLHSATNSTKLMVANL